MNITMGNDEFILYIRKQYPECTTPSPALGRQIWAWIQKADVNAQRGKVEPSYWGDTGDFISDKGLPESTTQFTFDRAILPGLYTYLDTLGTGK